MGCTYKWKMMESWQFTGRRWRASSPLSIQSTGQERRHPPQGWCVWPFTFMYFPGHRWFLYDLLLFIMVAVHTFLLWLSEFSPLSSVHFLRWCSWAVPALGPCIYCLQQLLSLRAEMSLLVVSASCSSKCFLCFNPFYYH